MQTKLPKHEIVLLGIGHTNAHVLRMWRMEPIPGARLTCVTNFPIATYSGMLPGTLAGIYTPAQMEIDLVRLASAAGARLIEGEVVGIDHANQRLELSGRPSLPFDLLSIGIGSVPKFQAECAAGAPILAIKPMQTFLSRFDEHLLAFAQREAEQPLRVVVVGAGVAGCEIAFAVPERIRQVLGERSFTLQMVDAHSSICQSLAEKSSRKVADLLSQRGVSLVLGQRVTFVGSDHVEIDSGEQLPADLVLLATSAVAPPLLTRLGLPTDERGFLLTEPTLASTVSPSIFAVGDSGTIENNPLPKAGVYAVRQGPILWENLRRSIQGVPLQEFRPQSKFLKLLSTADRRAVFDYRGFTFHGAWCFQLKDYIDRRFMAMYQNYEPMPTMPSLPSEAAQVAKMRCAGCGGKLGGSSLSKVLARLEVPTNDHVVLGLAAADDAAIVRMANGGLVAATVDFFQPPLDDYYLSGRIAAINSASDLYAIGAQPVAALAMCIVPPGVPRQQEQLLFELLSGALEEFAKMNIALVGGHTTEGAEAAIGFTILGQPGDAGPQTKAGLRPGDQLVLTKPLGTGTLLAAHMQACCRAQWMKPLVAHLLQSNQEAAAVALQLGVLSLTDVTGFGLAGHLLEMLAASRCSAELRLGQIPLLAGAAEMLEHGIESTLAPDNRLAEAQIDVLEHDREMPQYAALFDPQTCGGLLIGIAKEKCHELLESLQEIGANSVVIGHVRAGGIDPPRIKLL